MIAVWMMLLSGCFAAGCGNGREELILADETSETEETSEKKQEDLPVSVTPEVRQSAEDSDESITVSEIPEEIYVDVCGAVVSPGVYRLDQGSRVFQAIEAAGGMQEEAASSAVNQAQPVSDGQQIYVPTQEEVEQGNISVNASSGTQTQEGQQQSAEDGKINLNTADTETLKTLSGVGDSKAQAIVAWREENGGFSSIEDIMQVPGIKESTFAKIKDKIAVE